jgi:integration host factor subunit beta
MADNDDQMKMTKAEIIENIYESSGISRKDIHSVIDSFFEEVKDALTGDRVVELRGFGTFEIRTRKGREKARNPKTGEIVSPGLSHRFSGSVPFLFPYVFLSQKSRNHEVQQPGLR